MRKGTGDRPDRPSYSFRSIGSLGISSILNAHNMRDMASQISRSATQIPGQIRRLQNISEQSLWFGEEAIPSAKNPMIPLQWVDQVGRFRRKRRVIDITLRLHVQNRSSDRRIYITMDNLALTSNVWGSGCLWGSWCIVYCEQLNVGGKIPFGETMLTYRV